MLYFVLLVNSVFNTKSFIKNRISFTDPYKIQKIYIFGFYDIFYDKQLFKNFQCI